MIFILPVIVLASLVSGKGARVIGGDEVHDTTTFPWIVGILNRNLVGMTYYQQQYCGGSIIDQSWILTAAHCVDGTQAHEISIVAGTYNLSNMDMGSVRNVSAVHCHEDYNNFTLENDIALLKLEKPLNLSDSVGTIALANMNDPRNPGQVYTLAGWGAISFNHTTEYPSYDPILKTVDIADVPYDVCLSFAELDVTMLAYLDINIDNYICAGDTVGENACFGDSGGPLSMTVGSTDILYGITSFVFLPCGREGPSGYAAVAMYQDWVANITGLSNPSSKTASNVNVYVVIGLVAGIVCFCFIIILCSYRAFRTKKLTENENKENL